MQHDQKDLVMYKVKCQSPGTTRTYKELSFGHMISEVSADNYNFGLHSVTFSPQWDYMAIATVESSKVFKFDQDPSNEGRVVMRTFLWKLADFDVSEDEIFYSVPWTSLSQCGGKLYHGLVEKSVFSGIHGSKCSIAFDGQGSTLYTPEAVYDLVSGKSTLLPCSISQTLKK